MQKVVKAHWQISFLFLNLYAVDPNSSTALEFINIW